MSAAYYNEIDPYAAAWLRNLIAAGHIAPGDVDERSIEEVQPDDLRGYDQAHFFAGIGGWSLALRLAGWPDDRPVWTGSCPCQPFSAAGKRKGTNDERHLWPEFLRLIAERRPSVVLGEQVASKDGRLWLAGVRADVEALGYAVGAADLCAAGAGAPHIRQRLFWVADAAGERQHGRQGAAGQGWRHGVEDGRADGRLADAHGGLAGDGHLQSGGQHGQQPQDGGAGGVEHAQGDGRIERRAEPGGWGSIGGCGQGAPGERLGDALRAGPSGQPLGLLGAGHQGNRPGFWSDFELIPCLDGKARRTQPGLFPLAHGVPGRVGKLRAAGNAIVPQVAAEFIRAWLEARSLTEAA